MKFKWDKKYLYWGITGFLVISASSVFVIGLSSIVDIISAVFSFLAVLTPVLYGFIIAYILAPVATFIEKPCLRRLFYTIQDKKRERFLKKYPDKEPPPKTFPVRKVARVTSVAITILFALALLVGLVWILLPQLIQTVTTLVNNMDEYVKSVTDWVSGALANYPEVENYVLQITDGISDKLNTWLSSELLPQMNNLWNLITSNVMNIISVTMNLLLGFVIAIYFLNSKELFAAQSKKIVYCIFSTKHANRIIETARDINKSFGQFLTGKLIDSFIIGALYVVVMNIFQMPYAVLCGVIMGVLSIIPYFGTFIGYIPCMLLMLLADPIQCLYFTILVVVIQNIDGNILAPKIIGDSTGLSSFWVIFGMLVGQGIFGFTGLIIGIPLFAVVYSFIKNRVNKGLKNKDLPDDSNEYRDIHHINEETGEAVMFPHPPYMKNQKGEKPVRRSFRFTLSGRTKSLIKAKPIKATKPDSVQGGKKSDKPEKTASGEKSDK